jgi:hypothetical protein
MSALTLFGIFIVFSILFYVIIQILNLFDITIRSLYMYIMFFGFIFMSMLVLQTNIPEV